MLLILSLILEIFIKAGSCLQSTLQDAKQPFSARMNTQTNPMEAGVGTRPHSTASPSIYSTL